MILEIRISNYGSMLVYINNEDFQKIIKKHLPFMSNAEVWKEEVYFQTPIGEDIKGEKILRVVSGDVCYWPPGRALCLFYGITQPYSPVVKVGEIIGPCYGLRDVENGSKLEVKEYQLPKDYKDIISLMRKHDIIAGTRITDIESIVLNYHVKGRRIGIEVYVEEYGYHIEGDALFKYIPDPYALSVLNKMRKSIEEYEGVRVDTNEDGYVCLTSYARDKEELINRIKELAIAYDAVLSELNINLGF